MATNMWTADRRLYLDKDGKVVEADDPTRVKLLVAAGGSIPLANAERLGLVEVVPAEVKAIAPKVNKARSKAPENKSPMADDRIGEQESRNLLLASPEGKGKKAE